MENKRHEIAVDLTPAGYGSKILIDGIEIPRVKKFVVICEAGKVTRVELEVLALDGVTVNGIADVIDIVRKQKTARGHGEKIGSETKG